MAALAGDLGDRMQDVVIMTMSEFGRSVNENGSRGTDHGHGNAMMVLGGAVRGGTVYGRWPGLAREQRHDGRDLAITATPAQHFSGRGPRSRNHTLWASYVLEGPRHRVTITRGFWPDWIDSNASMISDLRTFSSRLRTASLSAMGRATTSTRAPRE